MIAPPHRDGDLRIPPRLVAALVLAALLGACSSGGGPVATPTSAPLAGIAAGGQPASNFSLVDQFGRQERLSDFRGNVVLLSFIDDHCTTVCPLTAELMKQAEEAVAGHPPVQLLAVNANPKFTSVAAVRRWSQRHAMTHSWLFMTASPTKLEAVWKAYGIQSAIVHGDDVHTAIVFVIDPAGRIQTVFPIARRGGIGAEAQTLAQAIRQVAA